MDIIKYLMNRPHRRMIKAGCDMLLMAKMASGNVSGVNSPLTNPWIDLTKNGNNATFQNLAGTTSDGWVNVLLPNSKTMPFIKLDGVNTVGIIPNNPSVDIVGLDEFEIDSIILTPSTIVFGYLISKNLENTTNLQYSVAILANGSIEVRLNTNAYTVAPIGTIVANTVYNIVIKRQSGRLICLINGVEVYNQANIVSIVTQPNFRLGAISTNVGGTTHSTFSNVYTGILSISKNPDFTKLSFAWTKIIRDYVLLSLEFHVSNGDRFITSDGNILKVNEV